MKRIYLLLLAFFSIIHVKAQSIVEVTELVSYDLDYFQNDLGVAFSLYGTDLYRVLYTTKSLAGTPDTASGLLVIPHLEDVNFPLLSYAHGTVDSRFEVPGYLSFEHNLPAIYASMGVVAVAPDYIGLGASKGIHPYVHAASETWASADMITAVKNDLQALLDVKLNDQLFITGYSQGGHTAMALHRYYETETDVQVAAALPMSGPYSISEGMLDLLTSDEAYGNVAYVAWTAISYQEVYGTIYPNGDIDQFFKAPYADIIKTFISEEASLLTINEQLIEALIENEGIASPKKMIFDDIIDAILTDTDHPVNIALRDNDVYDWKPEADTRLFYCSGDDQVAYQNSVIARDKMVENGATQVVAEDLNPEYDHVQCVTPAATRMVFYLIAFSSPTNTDWITTSDFEVYPNPTTERITFRFDNEIYESVNADLYDISGQKVLSFSNVRNEESSSINLMSGMYLVQLKTTDNQYLGFKQLIVK